MMSYMPELSPANHRFIDGLVEKAWTNKGLWNHGPGWSSTVGFQTTPGFFHGSWFIGSFKHAGRNGYRIVSVHGVEYTGHTLTAVVTEFINAYDNATSKGQPA